MKKTVRDIDVSGKKVLVRCDFNVPMQDGKITDDRRITAALPTIEYLIEQNANMALHTADRGYVMETGEIILEGAGRELLENPVIREAYLGK